MATLVVTFAAAMFGPFGFLCYRNSSINGGWTHVRAVSELLRFSEQIAKTFRLKLQASNRLNESTKPRPVLAGSEWDFDKRKWKEVLRLTRPWDMLRTSDTRTVPSRASSGGWTRLSSSHARRRIVKRGTSNSSRGAISSCYILLRPTCTH